jgi:thiamine-monophosphate kinase
VSEFDLIARYFRPLTNGMPGALALTDDAALLDPPPGRSLVVTADALVAGVHFRPADAPGDVARKALRVNLSDLAAKGSEPMGYVLTLALPKPFEEAWVAAFAAGLGADQAAFGIGLLGGDTVATPGPVTVSVTAFGHCAPGTAILRSGASAGEAVYVSGTIGDGALGLSVLEDGAFAKTLGEQAAEALANRYLRPEPRLGLGRVLVGQATAAADVSDGLVADLGHICAASGLGARVRADRIPLSPAARLAVETERVRVADLATGGDDYEIVFAAPPGLADGLVKQAGCPVTEIGHFETGAAVVLVDEEGRAISLDRSGYTHG